MHGFLFEWSLKSLKNDFEKNFEMKTLNPISPLPLSFFSPPSPLLLFLSRPEAKQATGLFLPRTCVQLAQLTPPPAQLLPFPFLFAPGH
jgi:hypothetical protein